MSRVAVDAARLPVLLNELRLPTFGRLWTGIAETADAESWPAARFLVSEDFAPVPPTLDDQLFSAVAHRHGMSSSMRRFGQPLTRRVRRSAK